MTKLNRPHYTQELNATVLDEGSLISRERVPACQQEVDLFACTDEIRGLFTNRKHRDFSLTNRETRNAGGNT